MNCIPRDLICHHNTRNSIFGRIGDDYKYDVKTATAFMHSFNYELKDGIQRRIKHRGAQSKFQIQNL